MIPFSSNERFEQSIDLHVLSAVIELGARLDENNDKQTFAAFCKHLTVSAVHRLLVYSLPRRSICSHGRVILPVDSLHRLLVRARRLACVAD